MCLPSILILGTTATVPAMDVWNNSIEESRLKASLARLDLNLKEIAKGLPLTQSPWNSKMENLPLEQQVQQPQFRARVAKPSKQSLASQPFSAQARRRNNVGYVGGPLRDINRRDDKHATPHGNIVRYNHSSKS